MLSSTDVPQDCLRKIIFWSIRKWKHTKLYALSLHVQEQGLILYKQMIPDIEQKTPRERHTVKHVSQSNLSALAIYKQASLYAFDIHKGLLDI